MHERAIRSQRHERSTTQLARQGWNADGAAGGFVGMGSGAGSAGAQPARCGCRYSTRCVCGVYGRFGIRQVVAGVRHDLCRGAASLLRIGRALCASATGSGRGPGYRFDRGIATDGGATPISRRDQFSFIGGNDHLDLERAADALQPRRSVPECRCSSIGLGLVLAEYRRRCLPHLSRVGHGAHGQRVVTGAR